MPVERSAHALKRRHAIILPPILFLYVAGILLLLMPVVFHASIRTEYIHHNQKLQVRPPPLASAVYVLLVCHAERPLAHML